MTTAPLADAVSPRKATSYEDWRPPLIGVSLLIPVGADALVVAEILGGIVIPTGTVHDGRTPHQASQDVLRCFPEGLPDLRRVALAWVQTRRRKVITYVLATTRPMTRESVGRLAYRDPRADLRVLPTLRVVEELAPRGRLRLLAGLQALATGETAYIDGDAVRPSPPTDLIPISE